MESRQAACQENSCKKKRLNRQKQSQSIKLKAKSLSDLLNHPYPRRGAAEESPAAKKPPVKRSAAGSDAEKVKKPKKKAGAKPAKRRRLTDAEGKPVRPKASRPISNDETAEISEKPEKDQSKRKSDLLLQKNRFPQRRQEKKASAKKPVKRHPEEASDTNKNF